MPSGEGSSLSRWVPSYNDDDTQFNCCNISGVKSCCMPREYVCTDRNETKCKTYPFSFHYSLWLCSDVCVGVESESQYFFPFLSAYFSFTLRLFLAHQIRTSFNFVRTSFTDDNCFVIWAMSASESANDMSNRSRSGLRWNGPRVGVVLRARRLYEETSTRQRDEEQGRYLFSSGSSSNETFGTVRYDRRSSALDER